MAGYAWRGRRACLCVIDATADYEASTKTSLKGRIYQACYSFAPASKGTHGGGGALDTTTLNTHQTLRARTIGFWPSNRSRAQGFSINHAHWVLFGCPHAPPGLKFQERELRAGRNGLRSRGRDTGPRPGKVQTYRQWKATQNKPAPAPKPATYIYVTATKQKLRDRKVTVKGVNAARRAKKSSIHTYWIQVWLRRVGFYMSPIDARWGVATRAALDNFRAALDWPAADCVGPIGITSLTRLAQSAKTNHPYGAK